MTMTFTSPPTAQSLTLDSQHFDLVIFDCDGVLVDSERLTNEIGRQMLAELGLELTIDKVTETFAGHSTPACRTMLEEMLGHALPDDFPTQWERRVAVAFKRSLKPIDGIAGLLPLVKQAVCVASNSSMNEMRLKLELTGLSRFFGDNLFSGLDVAAAKPAPDVYLRAAERMGVPPARCIVIEDTSTGVQAAVAAGMTVFGYSGLMPGERLLAAGAAAVFRSMSALTSD